MIVPTLFDQADSLSRQKIIDMGIERTRRFMPVLQKIIIHDVGSFISLKEATIDQDMKEAFDFVITMDAKNIAVRIRTPNYYCFDDVTIRYRSEFDKIKSGLGSMYLYAWTKDINGHESIKRYVIFDLNKLRESGFFETINWDKRRKPNTDGYTSLVWITISELIKHKSLCAYKEW